MKLSGKPFRPATRQLLGEWGKLTDNDLDVIEGRHEKLVGLVQERYDYACERAEREVEHFLHKYGE